MKSERLSLHGGVPCLGLCEVQLPRLGSTREPVKHQMVVEQELHGLHIVDMIVVVEPLMVDYRKLKGSQVDLSIVKKFFCEDAYQIYCDER